MLHFDKLCSFGFIMFALILSLVFLRFVSLVFVHHDDIILEYESRDFILGYSKKLLY